MKIEENAFIKNSLGINSRCRLSANLESIEDLNNIGWCKFADRMIAINSTSINEKHSLRR